MTDKDKTPISAILDIFKTFSVDHIPITKEEHIHANTVIRRGVPMITLEELHYPLHIHFHYGYVLNAEGHLSTAYGVLYPFDEDERTFIERLIQCFGLDWLIERIVQDMNRGWGLTINEAYAVVHSAIGLELNNEQETTLEELRRKLLESPYTKPLQRILHKTGTIRIETDNAFSQDQETNQKSSPRIQINDNQATSLARMMSKKERSEEQWWIVFKDLQGGMHMQLIPFLPNVVVATINGNEARDEMERIFNRCHAEFTVPKWENVEPLFIRQLAQWIKSRIQEYQTTIP